MSKANEREPIHPWRWRILWIWMLVFSALTFWLFHDARQARIDSCRVTHESIREVFRPFFAGSPPAAVKRFNDRVDQRKALCAKTVG